jgi:hypothetical protein
MPGFAGEDFAIHGLGFGQAATAVVLQPVGEEIRNGFRHAVVSFPDDINPVSYRTDDPPFGIFNETLVAYFIAEMASSSRYFGIVDKTTRLMNNVVVLSVELITACLVNASSYNLRRFARSWISPHPS